MIELHVQLSFFNSLLLCLNLVEKSQKKVNHKIKNNSQYWKWQQEYLWKCQKSVAMMTSSVTKQLKLWINWKYNCHRTNNGGWIHKTYDKLWFCLSLHSVGKATTRHCLLSFCLNVGHDTQVFCFVFQRLPRDSAIFFCLFFRFSVVVNVWRGQLLLSSFITKKNKTTVKVTAQRLKEKRKEKTVKVTPWKQRKNRRKDC